MLKTHKLLDILNLLVLHNLIVLHLMHVEKLTTQREDAKVVMPTTPSPAMVNTLAESPLVSISVH